MVGTRTTVELYARSSLPDAVAERRADVADRLSRMLESGRLAEYATETWPAKVPLAGDSRERALYERFSEWAEESGVGLEPFFDTRTCYSMDSGDLGERLVLPVLCLAVYRDGELASVYPHATAGESRTVVDGLRAIGSGPGRVRADVGETVPSSPGASD